MLKLRLIIGTLLSAGAIGLYWLDAYLSTVDPPRWLRLFGVDLGEWMYEGAISTGLALAFTCAAAHEIVGFYKSAGHRPYESVVQLFAAGAVVGPWVSYHLRAWFPTNDEGWSLMWLASAMALVYLVQAVRKRTENALINMSATIFVIFYTGGLVGFLTKLRMQVGGTEGVLLVGLTIIVAKMADIGAYFTGRALGRNKLIEWLSPKKTWEGFIGGLATSILAAWAFGWILQSNGWLEIPVRPLAYPMNLLVFGMMISLLSVAGDLCASMLKRDAAIKDSGRAFPGMGGVLDVLDSLMLAAPGAWFYWTRVMGMQGA